MGRVQNFGFGSILSTFFSERVPGLSPRVDIVPHGVRDPSQWRWENVMRRLGGGRVANPYLAEFFPWWQRQIIAIDDYPYARIDFCKDLDMLLPAGEAYGDIGNESQTHFLSFWIILFFLCFLIYWLKRHIFCVTKHSDNLSCVWRCRTIVTRRLPSSSTEGKRRWYHGYECGEDVPKHSHKLRTLDA